MAQDSSRADFWETRYQQGVIPWDAGQMPSQFVAFAAARPPGERVLAPGCGSGYEVRGLAEHGAQVLAVDFSAAAVARAREVLGEHADCVREGDFFQLDEPPFDWLYERALLCALPPKTWDGWAAQTARLVRPGGVLAGYFFIADTPKGPPFGISEARLAELLGAHFTLASREPAADSLPVFAGREHWMVWRRR